MTENTRLRRSTTLIALASATALVLTACAPSEAAPAEDPARTGLTALMSDAVDVGVPGTLVRIDTGDEVISLTERADWAAAFSADDTFRVGSNTKTATAVLILQLVDEGRLSLDDPISTWFADAVPASDTMTVRTLLNHTSGLADYALEPEILAAVAGLREELPSDDEQITGRSLHQVFQEKIAEPLGLTETHFPARGAGETAKIRGYEPDAEGMAPLLPPGTPEGFAMAGPKASDGWIDVTAIDQSWDEAAGSIISTSAEWATFQRAVMGGDLVPTDLLDQMQHVAPEDDESGPGRSYGLGLEKVETPCGAVWGHDGALPGYRADTYTDQAGTRSITVVSTTNFGLVAQPEASAAHDHLVKAATCAMYGKPIPTEQDAAQ